MAQVILDGERFAANIGERLSDVLLRAGKAIPLPCAGRGTCGKCHVIVDGQPELACAYRIERDCTVLLPQADDIVSEIGAPQSHRQAAHPIPVLDVGTTTLALALVSQDDGSLVRAVTRANPQRAFGADVMSRIAYCSEHGPAGLQQTLLDAVREMLRELDTPPCETLYAAGNMTMLHLLFGVDPSPMGTFPYMPAFLGSQTASGESLGLPGIGNVVSLPGAAAFVGADLTAGLELIGLPPQGTYRLLIDLGTNAEVILFSQDAALCTAAAAGPCFEGANISCGMSASTGAVCAFSEAGYRTIGDTPAAGLCGTGLIDVIAVLCARGTIDKTGYMACGTFDVAPGVTLTQNDVRQYQLAKSAVCSSVQTLLQRQNVAVDAIDTLFISGGFSARIHVSNAVKTGLLPASFAHKCVPLGNSSLLGTAKYACERNDLAPFLAHMQYVDLAADPVFSERFIENMAFG